MVEECTEHFNDIEARVADASTVTGRYLLGCKIPVARYGFCVNHRRRANVHTVVLSQEHRELSDDERRRILEVADALVYLAGRTTLALALRGSRNQKLARYEVEQLPGYGMYRGMPEEEVLARIDQLVREGILRVEPSDDGFPLLAFTDRGLELSETFTAERWLALLREHVADDEPFHPPFAYDLMPNRNARTLSRLLDALETAADAAWLPLLTAWSSHEVKKVRARLAPLCQNLQAAAPLKSKSEIE